MRTIYAMILDESGSMMSIKDNARTSINEAIQDIKEKGKARDKVFLYSFNDTVKDHMVKADVKVLKEFSKDSYTPGGLTALNDCIGKMFKDIEKNVKDNENTRYLVTIITDGYENASKDYTTKDISEAVKERNKSERWSFLYIGANQDMHQVNQDYGIKLGNTFAFTASAEGMQVASHALRSAREEYMTNSVAQYSNLMQDK